MRQDVRFRGRVQGVGFRYTTRHIASRFAVTGYVQNLPDGSVRLVVEGGQGEVARFIAGVGAEMSEHIHSHDVETLPATGEFSGFEVRR